MKTSSLKTGSVPVQSKALQTITPMKNVHVRACEWNREVCVPIHRKIL